MAALDQEILRLIDAVGGLKAEVKNLRETWGHQDLEANQGRRRLHEKFDALQKQIVEAFTGFQIEINRRMAELDGRVDKIKEDLIAIKPSILTFNEEHHQTIGSKRERGKIWAWLMGLLTIAGTMGAGIAELVHALWPATPPHH